jgi:hypothetical protein
VKTKKLTVDEVLAQVEKVRAYAEKGDNEAAHSREDSLYKSVLEQLAASGNKLAIAALKTADIEFDRWCA